MPKAAAAPPPTPAPTPAPAPKKRRTSVLQVSATWAPSADALHEILRIGQLDFTFRSVNRVTVAGQIRFDPNSGASFTAAQAQATSLFERMSETGTVHDFNSKISSVELPVADEPAPPVVDDGDTHSDD